MNLKSPVKKVRKPIAAFNAFPEEIQKQILTDAKLMSKFKLAEKYGVNYKYVCDWFVIGITSLK
jgi:hypothetical protein